MMEMLGNEKYLWFPNLCSSLRSCQVLCYWWLCKCKWYAAALLPAELLRTLPALVGTASSQPRLPRVAFLLSQHSTMGSILPHEPSTIILLAPYAAGGPLVFGDPSQKQGGGTAAREGEVLPPTTPPWSKVSQKKAHSPTAALSLPEDPKCPLSSHVTCQFSSCPVPCAGDWDMGECWL